MTDTMAERLVGSNTTAGTEIKIIGYITDPVVDNIIEVIIFFPLLFCMGFSLYHCRLIKKY